MAIGDENNRQAEHDANTLKAANDIKNDPKRMEAAQGFVADLKAGVGGQKPNSPVRQPKETGTGKGVKAGLVIH